MGYYIPLYYYVYSENLGIAHLYNPSRPLRSVLVPFHPQSIYLCTGEWLTGVTSEESRIIRKLPTPTLSYRHDIIIWSTPVSDAAVTSSTMQTFKEPLKRGPTILHVALRGSALLNSPRFNKGTAFTAKEREEFGLTGRLPLRVNTLEQQAKRAYAQLNDMEGNLRKNGWDPLIQIKSSSWWRRKYTKSRILGLCKAWKNRTGCCTTNCYGKTWKS